MSHPIIHLTGTEDNLPAGLFLTGDYYAEQLPDGRLVPIGLPPDTHARFFPDLVIPPDEDTPPASVQMPDLEPVIDSQNAAELPPPPIIPEV